MLLQVNDLKTYFASMGSVLRAVDGISFTVNRRHVLGIVGESGCGKSVTALSIMRLIPQPPGQIVNGEVVFEGKDLLKLSKAAFQHIRGSAISMIFQEPMTSLNPVFTVGEQIMEALLCHQRVGRREAREQAIEAMQRVRIPSPEQRIDEYPYQLSGGMRQRVMIAMALVCNPKLLIADEPTTALDVTIQAQILDLMSTLREETEMSILLITHDLGVISEMADDIIVMYAGKIMEYASVLSLFTNPQHPYTLGLLGSIPQMHLQHKRLFSIEGFVPNLFELPQGCGFNPRCPVADVQCRRVKPPLTEIITGHYVACWKAPFD